MDILIILLGTVLFLTGTILKLNVLYMMTFLVAVFNDFIRITKIKKKQDEREKLITTNTDALTYFLILGLLVILQTASIKMPWLFKSIPQLLCNIIIAVCLIHSTVQIHCSSESGKIYAMIYGSINDMDAFLKVHHMICSLIDNMKTMKMIDEK